MVFLFNLSSHHHIYIVKYLLTSRDDCWESLGGSLCWHTKCWLPVSDRGSKHAKLPTEHVPPRPQLRPYGAVTRGLSHMRGRWFWSSIEPTLCKCFESLFFSGRKASLITPASKETSMGRHNPYSLQGKVDEIWRNSALTVLWTKASIVSLIYCKLDVKQCG